MLISGKNVVDGKSKIIPNVSRNLVSDRDPLDMFYEIYSDTNRNLTIDYEIFNESVQQVYTSSQIVKVKSGKNQIFHNLDSLVLDLGKHLLKVSLKDSTQKVIDTSIKSFTSRWVGVRFI